MRDWLSEGDDPDDVGDDDTQSLDDIASMEHVYEMWISHNKRCNCGSPITFDEAYYDGVCATCWKAAHTRGTVLTRRNPPAA